MCAAYACLRLSEESVLAHRLIWSQANRSSLLKNVLLLAKLVLKYQLHIQAGEFFGYCLSA